MMKKCWRPAMSLCSDAELDKDSGEAVGEPTECALVNDAAKNGLPKTELERSMCVWARLLSIPCVK